MSHVNSEFEFAPCLTVLTGPNNSGKSAVVEALQCLSGRGRKGNYMVRHGEKETSVEVETGEGDVVQWRRIKDTPSYVINGIERFRGTPEDLDPILRLPSVPAKEGNEDFDVHFGEQKWPIFLIGETGSRAATFFASSSDAQYLMQMQDLHKQRTRDAKSDALRIRGEVKRLDERLEQLDPLDRLEPLIAEAEHAYTKLVDATQDLEALEAAVEILKVGASTATVKRKPAEALVELTDPPTLKPDGQLLEIVGDLLAARTASLASELRAKGLKTLIAPPKLQDEAGLSEAVEGLAKASKRHSRMQRFVTALAGLPEHPEYKDLGPLRDALDHMNEAAKSVAHYRRLLDEAVLHVGAARDQISAWAKENETCPTCGAPIDANRMLAKLEAAVA